MNGMFVIVVLLAMAMEGMASKASAAYEESENMVNGNIFEDEVDDQGAITVDLEALLIKVSRNKKGISLIKEQAQTHFGKLLHLTLKSLKKGNVVRQKEVIQSLIRGWRRGKGQDTGQKLTLRVLELEENIDWPALLGEFGDVTSAGISNRHSLNITAPVKPTTAPKKTSAPSSLTSTHAPITTPKSTPVTSNPPLSTSFTTTPPGLPTTTIAPIAHLGTSNLAGTQLTPVIVVPTATVEPTAESELILPLPVIVIASCTIGAVVLIAAIAFGRRRHKRNMERSYANHLAAWEI